MHQAVSYKHETGRSVLEVMRPLLESNQHLALRRGLFYPLN